MTMLTAHFARSELACRCGCGQMAFGAGALARLEALRQAFQAPMLISSGYRCPEYNRRVSDTGTNGPHTVWRDDAIAVDVRLFGARAARLIRLALDHSWTGIGVAQKGEHSRRFIHIDRMPGCTAHPRPWVWSY